MNNDRHAPATPRAKWERPTVRSISPDQVPEEVIKIFEQQAAARKREKGPAS